MTNQNKTQTNKITKHEGSVKMNQNNLMTTYNTFSKAQLHFGDNAWIDHIGNDGDNNEVYAVYNDDIDDTFQLGTITEVNNSTFIATDFDDTEKQPSVLYCDTLDEFSEWKEELDGNPDFEFYAVFQSIDEIADEFNYQGATTRFLINTSKARYGDVIEIAYIEGDYFLYIGAR